MHFLWNSELSTSGLDVTVSATTIGGCNVNQREDDNLKYQTNNKGRQLN